MNDLIRHIRQQGPIYERGDNNISSARATHFAADDADRAPSHPWGAYFEADQTQESSSWAGFPSSSSSSSGWKHEQETFWCADGSCGVCGTYVADFTANDSDTDEETDPQWAGVTDTSGRALYEAYAVAKARWRSFAKRTPRRTRFFGSGKGKGKGKGHKGHRFHSEAYEATFDHLPSNSLAGGKGKGKSKGKNAPACHNCGALDHFIRDCPHPHGGGKGHSGKSRSAFHFDASLPGVYFPTEETAVVHKQYNWFVGEVEESERDPAVRTMFPCWEEDNDQPSAVYHSRTILGSEESG
jgi:hypothetical protein